jgi:hypothetical protein
MSDTAFAVTLIVIGSVALLVASPLAHFSNAASRKLWNPWGPATPRLWRIWGGGLVLVGVTFLALRLLS